MMRASILAYILIGALLYSGCGLSWERQLEAPSPSGNYVLVYEALPRLDDSEDRFVLIYGNARRVLRGPHRRPWRGLIEVAWSFDERRVAVLQCGAADTLLATFDVRSGQYVDTGDSTHAIAFALRARYTKAADFSHLSDDAVVRWACTEEAKEAQVAAGLVVDKQLPPIRVPRESRTTGLD